MLHAQRVMYACPRTERVWERGQRGTRTLTYSRGFEGAAWPLRHRDQLCPIVFSPTPRPLLFGAVLCPVFRAFVRVALSDRST